MCFGEEVGLSLWLNEAGYQTREHLVLVWAYSKITSIFFHENLFAPKRLYTAISLYQKVSRIQHLR